MELCELNLKGGKQFLNRIGFIPLEVVECDYLQQNKTYFYSKLQILLFPMSYIHYIPLSMRPKYLYSGFL